MLPGGNTPTYISILLTRSVIWKEDVVSLEEEGMSRSMGIGMIGEEF